MKCIYDDDVLCEDYWNDFVIMDCDECPVYLCWKEVYENELWNLCN